ncbi:YhjD/YihY/BrkB family envelope integrity protein [Polymorphospora sp. 2-325]|uniref:YhjD/YihY/BrkB family envelope integrity protein n=1 Tax=Polymorphospora lycopeni TaxID=3140240 RepID=A0ABV5CWI5_9ACTN
MKAVSRAWTGANRLLIAGRNRSEGFDHVCRAIELYVNMLAGRLAAAIAYYGFFAVFALGLVGYSVFGFVLQRSVDVRVVVNDFLRQNLPFLELDQIDQSSGTVGVVGITVLIITGIGWVEAIRSSQRLLYGLNQQPGYIGLRQIVDLAVLVGVFLLLGLSVAAVGAVEALLRWLVGRSVPPALAVSSVLLTVVVNMVLATALLVAVPRLRMSLRRLAAPVLVVAVGITLLNTAGNAWVVRTERNPAYTVVAGAVGLLVYLYLLNQLLLFGASLAATSHHGRVIDLTERPRRRSPTADEQLPLF